MAPTRNQKRLIDHVIVKLDAEEDEGGEKIPGLVECDNEDNDQHDIPDLESILSDDKEENPNIQSCKLQGLNWAPPSAIYDMSRVKLIY